MVFILRTGLVLCSNIMCHSRLLGFQCKLFSSFFLNSATLEPGDDRSGTLFLVCGWLALVGGSGGVLPCTKKGFLAFGAIGGFESEGERVLIGFGFCLDGFVCGLGVADCCVGGRSGCLGVVESC